MRPLVLKREDAWVAELKKAAKIEINLEKIEINLEQSSKEIHGVN